MSQLHRTPDRERVATLASGLLGVVAVIAVLLVALLTSDKAKSGAVGAPGNGVPAGNTAAAGGAQVNGNGPAASGAGSAGSAGSSTTTVSPAYFKAHFPTPPGARKIGTTPGLNAGNTVTKYYVASTLDAVKSYYQDVLARLGITWNPGQMRGGDGAIVGWTAPLMIKTRPYMLGSIEIRDRDAGLPAGQVEINAYLN